MRQLFLLRHAKAEAAQSGEADHERPLAERGRSDAKLMGAYLFRKNFIPQKILVSPAQRTRETFALIDPILKGHGKAAEEPRIYNAELDTLLSIVRETSDAVSSLMLVGHNPGMHALSFCLAKKGTGPTQYSTCGFCALQFDQPWKELKPHGMQLTKYMAPKLLKE